MLMICLPKTRYNKTDFPNLDDNFNGALIPLGIGDIHGLIPVCIDTLAQLYQALGHAIHAMSEVRTPDGIVLAAGVDYTLNAGNNQISLLATPLLAANTTYYFVVEADYGIGAAHLHLRRKDGYANGQLYTIDGADAWTAVPAQDLRFRIYGKESIGGSEALMVNNGYSPSGAGVGLRDVAGRTRIAQSFKTPVSTSFYITRIQLFCSKAGSPTGAVRIAILSAFSPAEVQVGVKSDAVAIPPGTGSPRYITFPQRATDSGIVCDVEAAEKTAAMIADGADTLEWLIVTALGKSAALLDPTYLADFKADRPYEVKLLLDKESMKFESIVGKLETTLLFKFVSLLDDTYGTVVYEAGEPAGTLHFKDEDFLSFSLRYDWSAVKYRVGVKYDEDAQGRAGFKVEEVTSDFARFFYETEEALEVETYHRTQAGAIWLGGKLSGMYEAPPLIAEFEVHGWGLDSIPAKDKVELTRRRACYAGGVLNGVLFRILKVQKKPGTSTVVFTAQLDAQTY